MTSPVRAGFKQGSKHNIWIVRGSGVGETLYYEMPKMCERFCPGCRHTIESRSKNGGLLIDVWFESDTREYKGMAVKCGNSLLLNNGGMFEMSRIINRQRVECGCDA
jgi:hypothetical protein